MTKVPLRGQKSVRNQSETSQKPAKRNLSLSLAYSLTLLPEILRLLLFQFPLPLPLLLVLLVLLWVFRPIPDRASLFCSQVWNNAFTHGSLLSLLDLLLLTPAAIAPPLPLVHLGISAFAFKSNWHESRWRVRNQSETRQKPVRNRPNATTCFPPSLSLFLSFPPSLPCY